jgi:uncharacterized protein
MLLPESITSKLKRCLVLSLAILAFLVIVGLEDSSAAPFAPPRPQIESNIVQVQGLFELLFGRPRTRPESSRPTIRTRRSTPSRQSGNSAPAVPDAVEKVESARNVVVIGDAMGSGLARGLATLFAESPDIVISNRTKPGSGIVRHDFYDWTAELPVILAEENPVAVVIMIGSNDRQDILGADGAELRTQKWLEIYERRVQNILDQIAARNVPIIWVGMPIMRSSSYGQDISFLNDLYEQQSNRVSAVFVETWNRFADADGKYNSSGPDVNGRTRRMRNDNGIHLTRQGNLKLAYFVEQELRPRLGEGRVVAEIEVEEYSNVSFEERRDLLGVEISLTSPAPGTGIPVLTGASARQEDRPGIGSGARLADLGTSPIPLTGRVDDFSWPPSAMAVGGADSPPL